VFISHKQANGAGKISIHNALRTQFGTDLAQAIKLQLTLRNPSLDVWLDVDDLHKLRSLSVRSHCLFIEQELIQFLQTAVENSKNVILLLTAGVLERHWVQEEIRAALKFQKNIILVHDEKHCPFPTGEDVPDGMKCLVSLVH
jgi:hypothetical protein